MNVEMNRAGRIRRMGTECCESDSASEGRRAPDSRQRPSAAWRDGPRQGLNLA